MIRIRNSDWKDDAELKENILDFVKRSYTRKEMVCSLSKTFPQYAWSLRTLASRLRHFDIKFIDYNTNIDEVYNAVENEIEGPGQKLGYRCMTQKIREIHGLLVPRDIIYEVMKDVNPRGFEERGCVGVSKRRKRNRRFMSQVNMLFSCFGGNKFLWINQPPNSM